MKFAILKHPIAILSGVAIGVIIGLFNTKLSAFLGVKNFAQIISFPGELYLFFLQMTVIPIVITAISSSLGKLMRGQSSAGLIKKITLVLIVCMTACAVIGMSVGMFGKPGTGLGENTRQLFAELLSSEQDGSNGLLEVTLGSSDNANVNTELPGMASFFTNMIPANIFQSLALGSVMAILFFSIIFGIAIGFLPNDSATLLVNLCTAIFQVFQKLINWSLYLLPVGLICLMAGQIAAVGVQIFLAMSKFIILYCVITVIAFVVGTAIIWLRSGIRNPLTVISMLFEPILLAFATRNSMAVLPSAINCLENKMGFDPISTNLTLPLGITLGRFGNIAYFALGVFFIAQIYNSPFEPIHYLVILIGVIFAGTATAGASGIVTLSMLSIVLDPLSLPMEAVLIIFMAIDPIIDPFRTFLNVHVNMAVTTLVAKHKPLLLSVRITNN
ncbi:MAG: dicarboxylate/amino acid:cation symporter [Chitinispirillales bacterium]|jgi:proton glutamate symport protein|nr:dicarboxylate/amino acid:cation symporter [Chitinispirillales bacterium]